MRKIIIIPVLLLGLIFELQAQSKKEQLQKEKEAIEKDIAYTNKLLSKTRKDRKSSLDELQILNTQIDKQEQLLFTIQEEVVLLENEIEKKGENIQEYNKEIDVLKDEYARLIRHAYKNRKSLTRLMFIFASQDFNQAYLRIKYLQQYNNYRRKQAEKLKSKQTILSDEVVDLEKEKEQKQELLTEQKKQKNLLAGQIKEKDQVINDLQSQEQELRAKLKKKEQTAAHLKNTIENLIASEVKKAGNNPNATVVTKKELGLTPKESELSKEFYHNKGKLPWPLAKGIVTNTFGIHDHPVLKGIKTKNNGIDIATETGASARSIFDGEVSGIASSPVNGKRIVIIRHGEYFSVYSNLESISVQKGEHVATKQTIGVVSNKTNSQAELHFQIWKGKAIQDPSKWLSK